MTFVPLLKSKKDARALSIDVLKENWPLSAKEIYKQVKNELTYQAIHKSLKQLEEDQIIIKKNLNSNYGMKDVVVVLNDVMK